MPLLRIGFLGVGAMGLSHVNQFHVKQGARAEAAAICSSNEARIKKALEIAPGAKVFRNEKELIHSDLDAVCISTPNFTHVPLALETLRAGRHLFLEKPVGVTREECRTLLAAAERTDRVVMIGHELRYSPYFQRMKALVDAGEIGRPRMVWTREFRGPFQPKSQNWIQDARRSGGMLVDKNCHHFDMMNWWVGGAAVPAAAEGVSPSKTAGETPAQTGGTPAPPPSPRPHLVAAFGSNATSELGAHQVNDHATVSFEYDNGVVGTLHVCLFARDFPEEELEMGIIGDAGLLQTRIIPPRPTPMLPPPSLSFTGGEGGRRQGEGGLPAPSGQEGTLEILQWKRGTNQKTPSVHTVHSPAGEGWGGHLGFDEIHAAFLDAVLDGKPHRTSVRDCVEGSLLAIAAEDSIRQSAVVKV